MNIHDRILCYGEILWDVLPDKKMPGGAPMNVALHLNNLGLDVGFVSRIGQDTLGEELKEYLASIGFYNYILQSDPDHPTSIAKVDMSDPDDPQYQFPDCAWDYLDLDSDLKKMLGESQIIVHGSLAARNKKSFDTLKNILEAGDHFKVFDINLRSPNYSKPVIEELLGKANLVKMNESELNVLSRWFFSESNEETLLRKISDRFNCQIITVTKGAGGASLLYEEDYYWHPGFKTHVKDTIGAGDAFLAGMLYGLLTEKVPSELLSFSCAMGAYVVTKTGANPRYDMDRVYKIMESTHKP